MMKVPQKVVGVVGRESSVMVKGAMSVDVLDSDDCIEFRGADHTADGVLLRFLGRKKQRGSITVDADGRAHTIPVAVFGNHEFFVTMVISSNSHLGLDPENNIRGVEHPSLHNVTGHGFFKTCRTLEPIYHGHGVPITWLIDGVVAADAHAQLNEFHQRYGDDFGLMPSSYFHHNSQNYNTQKSQEEVDQLLGEALRNLESHFDRYTTVLGVDQWIGSVGSKFVRSAEHLGLRGVWGLGYDHYTCDTSMFHRGCPWDMYKPDRDNIKLPSTYPSDVWAFQWTTRDIVNTVHTPDGKSSGSVIFSTDPDDIAATGIMQAQRDYYTRLLQEYKRGMGNNRFFVYLMHQEDHESHLEHDNVYMDSFLESVKDDEDLTFATLVEVEQWLNIMYTKNQHPTQMLVLEDALECKDAVTWKRARKPDDWGTYNTHCAFYNESMQVFFQKPDQTPLRVYDYAKRHPIDELDSYPQEEYGAVEVQLSCFENGRCRLVVESVAEYTNYPIAVWDVPSSISPVSGSRVMISTDCAVFIVNLEKGTNHLDIDLSGD
jgi:hypothetical protein